MTSSQAVKQSSSCGDPPEWVFSGPHSLHSIFFIQVCAVFLLGRWEQKNTTMIRLVGGLDRSLRLLFLSLSLGASLPAGSLVSFSFFGNSLAVCKSRSIGDSIAPPVWVQPGDLCTRQEGGSHFRMICKSGLSILIFFRRILTAYFHIRGWRRLLLWILLRMFVDPIR